MSSKSRFRFRSFIKRPANEAFAWHLRPRMMERSIPPWEDIKMIQTDGRPNIPGSKISMNARIVGCYWRKFLLEYSNYVPNESFNVIQNEGFCSDCEYTTSITPQSEHSCEVIDQFEFTHKLPKVFLPFMNGFIKKRLARLLQYKHEMIYNDLGLFEKYSFEKPLKILITGSHGFIGKNLTTFLEFAGHDVWHLSRVKKEGDTQTLVWDDSDASFEGFDVVVNLAGENIGKGRWTRRKKERILKSRYEVTERLVEILKKLQHPPQTFINASAVGYYGDQGSDVVNESSPPREGLFISEVCEHWERSSRDLEEKGVRVVQSRFGMVLSSGGGALTKILIPFKLGLGGKIGSGHQYLSWVAIDDVIGALYHIMMTPSISGPVNVSSPNPVTNAVFAKKLSSYLKRWLGPPVPEFFIRMLMGQKGEELLLTSTRVEPKVLTESGYSFQFPKLQLALEHIV